MTLSSEKKISGKLQKDRITLLFCCNYLGEKIKPLIIGKSKKPRWMNNKIDFLENIVYKSSKKAWMTRDIFTEWLTNLNLEFAKKKKKILLLLDNATCHVVNKPFSNIELFFLPKNTTSKVQPLDQGIIKVFKDNYKKFFLRQCAFIEYDIDYQTLVKDFKISDSIPITVKAWEQIDKTLL